MKVNDLGARLSEAVLKAYLDLDGRKLTLGEDVAVRSFLQMSASAIVKALEVDYNA